MLGLLDDPNWLSALALLLHDINPKPRRKPVVYGCHKRKEAFKWSTILDALARLAVHEPTEQIVALSAVPDNNGHIELHVAQDSPEEPSTRVAPHLRDICTRLVDVRAAINASPNAAALLDTLSQDPYLNTHSSDPILDPLRDLQKVLHQHSILHIRALFAKGSSEDDFNYVAACIQGPPTNTRDDMSKEQQSMLDFIRNREPVRDHFPLLYRSIRDIKECVESPSSADYNVLCSATAAIANVTFALRRDINNFNLFIRGTFYRTYHDAPLCVSNFAPSQNAPSAQLASPLRRPLICSNG